MGEDLLVVERLQHAAHGLALATRPVAHPACRHDSGGPVVVAGLLQVDDARRHVALVEAPLARLAAQPGDGGGLAPLELGPQELAEELMVAIPLAAIVLG